MIGTLILLTFEAYIVEIAILKVFGFTGVRLSHEIDTGNHNRTANRANDPVLFSIRLSGGHGGGDASSPGIAFE
jgi:hypothetical protein